MYPTSRADRVRLKDTNDVRRARSVSTKIDASMAYAFIASLLLIMSSQIAFANPKASLTFLAKVGQSCNASESKLLVASNQLMTDCGYVAWCDPTTNQCRERGCRRDEFPFGFNSIERSRWPSLCPQAQFCPDEGSMCMDKIALGGGCQLNRDDECATTTAYKQVRCLLNICTAVNATAGNACIHENVVYTTFTADNSSYGSIVSRDNCVDGLYCDSTRDVCIQRKAKGSACSADKECQTDYCQDANYTPFTPDDNNLSGRCADQPNLTAGRHRVWVYPVVFVVALLPMALLILILVKIHQSQGAQRRDRLQAYWDSQRKMNEKAQIFKHDLRSNIFSPNTPNSGSGSTPLLSPARKTPTNSFDVSIRDSTRLRSEQVATPVSLGERVDEASLRPGHFEVLDEAERPIRRRQNKAHASSLSDYHDDLIDSDALTRNGHSHSHTSLFMTYHGHSRTDSNPLGDQSAMAVEDEDHNVPINQVTPFDAAEAAGFHTPQGSQLSLTAMAGYESSHHDHRPSSPPSSASIHAATSHPSGLHQNLAASDRLRSRDLSAQTTLSTLSSAQNSSHAQGGHEDWSFAGSQGHKF